MKQRPKKKPQDLVGYCGLYCGDCAGYAGRIADLARDLRKELRAAGFDRTAAAFAKIPFFAVYRRYPDCYEVLGAMTRMRCPRTCRGGGANPSCRPRSCAQRKQLAGCWECGEFETCAKLRFLEGVHGDAHKRNLRVLKKKGPAAFARGKRYWYSAPPGSR